LNENFIEFIFNFLIQHKVYIFENLKERLKSVVKIQHFALLIKIRGLLKKNRSYLYIKTLFIINNKQKQTKQIKEKYE
tara:strand:+ start:315 stop:548 length:234 start_codon:yes stop_codon:yes gene_type:complete